ncbi:MAG: hypothetical protein AAAC48_28630 [Phyllobacterium sp.]|uniref:hypothetical protein n=1 Tax=Phyllobacterium sp. TaxID=1871046 RepID=UPI0030F2C660
MNTAARLPIVPLGLSVGSFFVITYVLCVLFGILVADRGMHQLLPQLLPGFTWITWPSIFLGLAWSFLYGWYVAVVFGPLFNFFSARRP